MSQVVLSRFIVPLLDPRADATRQGMRRHQPRDICSRTMRLALHLSSEEADGLERLNPDTLGRHDDEQLRSKYWADFINSPESEPFRVRRGI